MDEKEADDTVREKIVEVDAIADPERVGRIAAAVLRVE